MCFRNEIKFLEVGKEREIEIVNNILFDIMGLSFGFGFFFVKVMGFS